MDKEKKYYVYLHFRQDNGQCFYVGKGHGRRYKTLRGRSKLHKMVTERCGLRCEILHSGLTEEEAYQLEMETIQDFINQGYHLANNGYVINFDDKFLVNHTIGGEGGCYMGGELNPMYGISPKQRMDAVTYQEWFEKTHVRLNNQYGENNPNYNNDTLKKKLEQNPELKMLYYPRPGSQNGRAQPIGVLDDNNNLIKEFIYIGECCEWLKDYLKLKSNINSIRSNMSIAARNNKPYHGLMFKFLEK